jgi:multidrug efflux system outer membrane protein
MSLIKHIPVGFLVLVLVGFGLPAAAQSDRDQIEWIRSPEAISSQGPLGLVRDPRLISLLSQARTQAYDLRIAREQVRRAGFVYDGAKADSFPVITSNLSENRGDTTGGAFSLASLGIGLSQFELDIWGRVGDQRRAQKSLWEQAHFQAEAADLSLRAQLIQAYLNHALSIDILRLSEKTYEARSRSLSLLEKRATLGSISDLDIQLARGLEAQSRIDLANARTRLDQDKASLDYWVGTRIDQSNYSAGLEDIIFPQTLPEGVDTDFLFDRPDLRAAEAQLRAQKALVSVARKAYLPRLSLSLSAGRQSETLDLLLDGASIHARGLSIGHTLWDSGGIKSRLGLAKSARAQAVLQYEKSLATAVTETRQVLAGLNEIEMRLKGADDALNAAQKAFNLSVVRYEGGIDSYLSVLETERGLLNAQQGRLSALSAKYGLILRFYTVLALKDG